MARVMVDSVYPEPLSDEHYAMGVNVLHRCLELRAGAWKRSYMALDRRRMTCEFEAPDAESVREALRAAGVPFERVWAADLFTVEDFPDTASRIAAVEGARKKAG